MSTHDDELNRLLDALATGETTQGFELDGDTIDTASRFMSASAAGGPAAGFVSHLEAGLMERAAVVPAAVSGRIEHVGEGIGLIAALPQPRRLRVERIAAIAAVAILLLAASSFFRSGSDNGGHWLMAPVASASPVATDSVKCPDYTQEIADRLVATKLPTLPGNGIVRYLSADIGENLHFFPASMVPTGPSADTTTTAELQALSHMSSDCWGGLSLANQEPENIVLAATIQLEGGRVAAIYDYRLNDVPLRGYVAYVKFDGVWYWYESRLILPDDDLAAGTYLNAGTNWKTQMYETTYLDTQQTVVTVREMRVPAGQPVELTAENIGTVNQQFTISDSGNNIDEMVAPGESTTVAATFSPGWHTYSTIGEGDTLDPAVGYIYAEAEQESTPIASPESGLTGADCPTGEAWLATAEANGLSDPGVRFSAVIDADGPKPSGIYLQPAVYFQPAPNDPSTLIEVTALSDIPEGVPPSPDVREEVANQLPFDLFCFAGWTQSEPNTDIDIEQMTLLPDGSVGVLFDSDPMGFGTRFYVTYVQGSQQWFINWLTFVLPDADFKAPDDLKLQTVVLVQGWNQSSNGIESTNSWPTVVGVPAETDVTFDVKNIGYGPLTFAIAGTGVSLEVGEGESKDIVVTLSPGTYRYSLSGPSGTMEPGFIFAADAPTASATPTS